MITYVNYRIGNVTGNISTYRDEDEFVPPKQNDSISLNQPDIGGIFIVQSVNGPFTLSGRRTYTLGLTKSDSNSSLL